MNFALEVVDAAPAGARALVELARDGARFTDAHSPASVCTPTRYSLLTGKYAFRQPGTGIAPFRGFLHERRARGDHGRNWLFFGEQHAAHDFYYLDELEAFQRDGLLSELSLAFSRDQAEKIYVQDRLREVVRRAAVVETP